MNGLKSFLSGIPSRLSGKALRGRNEILADMGRQLVSQAHMIQGDGARSILPVSKKFTREGADPAAWAEVRRAFMSRDPGLLEEVSRQSAFFPMKSLRFGDDILDSEDSFTVEAEFDLEPQRDRIEADDGLRH